MKLKYLLSLLLLTGVLEAKAQTNVSSTLVTYPAMSNIIRLSLDPSQFRTNVWPYTLTNGGGGGAGNFISITNGAGVSNRFTNITLTGTVNGDVTNTGIWTWTNNPQVFKPLLMGFPPNHGLTGTLNSSTFTTTNATFTNWHIGDNIAFAHAPNDQYTVLSINSTSNITVFPSILSHTNDTNWFYYPIAVIFTDVNGNPFGTTIDDGGNLNMIDLGSGSAAIQLQIFQRALGGGTINMEDAANPLGPSAVTIGGNYTYGSTRGNSFTVSTMAPYNTLGVTSNGLVHVELGFTNIDNTRITNWADTTFTGHTIWTNDPQVIKPLALYVSNTAVSGTINTVKLTAAAGTFTGWNVGDNIYLAAGYQGQVIEVSSSSQVIVYPAFGSTHTAETGWQYSPAAFIVTDINGNQNGLNADSGGNLILRDGGGGPANINLQAGSGGAIDGSAIDVISAPGLFGPYQLTMGGNQGHGSTMQHAFAISDLARFSSVAILSNNTLHVQYGLTNYNDGSGGGAVTNLGDTAYPLLGTNQPLVLINQPNGRIITNITGGSDGQFLMKSNAATGGSVWAAASGGSQTPLTSSVDAAVHSITNAAEFWGNLVLADTEMAPSTNGKANLGDTGDSFGFAYINTNLLGTVTVTNNLIGKGNVFTPSGQLGSTNVATQTDVSNIVSALTVPATNFPYLNSNNVFNTTNTNTFGLVIIGTNIVFNEQHEMNTSPTLTSSTNYVVNFAQAQHQVFTLTGDLNLIQSTNRTSTNVGIQVLWIYRNGTNRNISFNSSWNVMQLGTNTTSTYSMTNSMMTISFGCPGTSETNVAVVCAEGFK